MTAIVAGAHRVDAEQPGPADDALVARARSGSVDAFEALYRRYSGRIHALCLRMTRSAMVAEDCVQETFVQAWQHLDRFEGRSAFGTWLHRIAVNRVLSVQRAESRRPAMLVAVGEDGDDPWGAAPGATDPGTDMDLERAIASLPDGARNVFVLQAVCGFSHEETARMLGIAVGTCKAQLHRARKLLEERLEP
ncbi:MAG: sigma-70 family RNA polymerase sigma factor [Gammaproteobacteria bacterium]